LPLLHSWNIYKLLIYCCPVVM